MSIYVKCNFCGNVFKKDNTSGVTGVHFCNTHKKWIVQSNINNKRTKIGQFSTKEEAVKARQDYEEYFYLNAVIKE
jgi:hypothetical protein